jgi:hypothetical protein
MENWGGEGKEKELNARVEFGVWVLFYWRLCAVNTKLGEIYSSMCGISSWRLAGAMLYVQRTTADSELGTLFVSHICSLAIQTLR